MGESITQNNKQLLNLNRAIQDYYNTFMSDISDINTGLPYFFSEMKNIGNEYRSAIAPGSSTRNANPVDLKYFIDSVVNFSIGNSMNDTRNIYKVKNTDSDPALNLEIVNNMHRMLNIINLFIDVLEAYIWFMTDNSDVFKVRIKDIENIHIVNKFTRSDAKATLDNYGYIHETIGANTLVLSINSFDNHSSGSVTINPAIKVEEGGSDVISYMINKTNNTKYPQYASVIYKRQSFSFSKETKKAYQNGSSTEYRYNYDTITGSSYSDTLNKRDQAIFSNFLYFLVAMDRDNARMQINALYYYYKFIKNYIYLIYSSVNIAVLSTSKSKRSDNYNTIRLMKSATEFYSSSDMILNITTDNVQISISPTTSIQYYNAIRSIILDDIGNSIAFLYSTNSTKDPVTKLVNTDYTVNVRQTLGMPEILTLDFSNDSSVSTIQSTFANSDNIDILKKRYNIAYRGKPYDIHDVDMNLGKRIIYIVARLQDNLNSELSHLPSIYAPSSDGTTRTIIGVRIMNKGLLSLKLQYNSNRQELSNINSSIRSNTTKINNQKNLYNYQHGKHKMLTNQLYIYGAIMAVILSSFIVLNIVGSNKGTQQMLSIVFSGVIILLIIIYYIINVSYMEEFQNYNKYGSIKEGFAIQQAVDIISISEYDDPNYIKNKFKFLSDNIEIVNNRYLEYFQKIRNILPLSETQDFFVQLNSIMEIESKEKKVIDNTLSYKRSLGYSNIDILKYEINTYKVYISTLLISFLTFTLLYMLSLFLPDDYRSLIIFMGLIIGVIILSYFLIFSNTYVRTKPEHKYWGPIYNDKL